MAYSSWAQSRFYAYWVMGDSRALEDQSLLVHPNWQDATQVILSYPKALQLLRDPSARTQWIQSNFAPHITPEESTKLAQILKAFKTEIEQG